MKIAVLGTSSVGRALAPALATNHDVVVGTRDPHETLARTETDRQGNPPYAEFQTEHPDLPLLALAEAVADADVVVNALNGAVCVEALAALADDLPSGVVVVDASNELDFSHGWPPAVVTAGGESKAEQLQVALPEARIVKSLNTMTASLMVDVDAVGNGDHTAFVSGDDADAKATVTQLLTELGWQDVLDLGDVTTARGVEAYFALWSRLVDATGNVQVTVKVHR